MLLGRLQEPGGRIGVLEKPPVSGKREEPEESGERNLGTARSSLTVIQNPSLDGYLGILMAANTRQYRDAKSFFNAYVIGAYGGVIDRPIVHVDIVKSEQQSGNPPLYVVLYYDNVDLNNGGRYHIASELPHEICEITDKEFRRFEATLTSPHQRIVELTGLVNNMMQLMGERLAGKGFAFEDGKLILPPNYANTRL